MAIDVTGTLLAVGVGGVDEVLEWWDEKEGRTEAFRTAKDIGRIAMVGLGLGLQVFMPRYAKYGDSLTKAATPLLVKAIAKPLRASLTAGTPAGAPAFVPRRVAPATRPSAPAGPTPVTQMVGRSYAPKFSEVMAW